VMKHFMTLMALAFAFTAGAQGTSIHEYPWNPDSNNDTFIGAEDLMGLLSTYGTQFGLPPEPCTYDGTPLEELMAGIAEGTIILDSMFVEYEIEDVSTYYAIGCPDPITDTVIIANSAMLKTFSVGATSFVISGINSYGYTSFFRFDWASNVGTYAIRLDDYSLTQLGLISDGFFGSSMSQSDYVPLPFPIDWYLDADGIHIESGWDDGEWVYYANYLHILPYWHYAE
jgi:hypothetical protein